MIQSKHLCYNGGMTKLLKITLALILALSALVIARERVAVSVDDAGVHVSVRVDSQHKFTPLFVE